MKNITIAILLGLLFTSHILVGQKKNVLFIAVDDLKPMLGCYGNTEIKTPNIDKLAESGTIFLNSHCQQAVCAPSRASLLTGLRPDKTKVWDLKTVMRDFVPDIVTMPQYFKAKGYETVAFGKLFDPRSVDESLDKKSWSIPYNDVNIFNYPEEIGEPFMGRWQAQETKVLAEKYLNEAIQKGLKGYRQKAYAQKYVKPSVEMADLPDEAYADGQTTINSIGMLKKLVKKEKPFFLAVGFKKPHLPFIAPKKYWDLYERENIGLSKWQEAPKKAPSFAMHSWGELKSYTDIAEFIQSNGVLTDEKQRELIHGYMASVSYIDTQVGKLLSELKKQGIAEETVIVLWGDHGWHLGDHNLWCKHSNFEQATHVPLIFSAPETKQGIKNNSPVEFVDIFPTLCDLANVEIPAHLDGESLKPIMTGDSEKVKDFAVSQYPRGNDRMGYSLRNEQYRYTAWFNIDFRKGEKATGDKIIAEELYDYQKDYNETRNLAGDKSYSKIKKELADKLIEFLN